MMATKRSIYKKRHSVLHWRNVPLVMCEGWEIVFDSEPPKNYWYVLHDSMSTNMFFYLQQSLLLFINDKVPF
jgi:hypothetical protein